MSFLSAPGNVGYSGLSQISDASCATQYKMGVEGAGTGAGACGEDEELSYFPHVSEPLFNAKFKMDPAELFTFQEADGVAGEITVYDDADARTSSPSRASPVFRSACAPNGLVKNFAKPKMALTNGHFPDSKPKTGKTACKTPNSARSPSRAGKDLSRSNSISEILASVGQSSPSGASGLALAGSTPNRNSINSVSKEKAPQFSSTSNSQSFLDVFKREMGSFSKPVTKEIASPPAKCEGKPAIPKKTPSDKRSGKTSGTSGGRGPAMHEALQRIPPPATAPAPTSSKTWHAPGPYNFECAPLTDKKYTAAVVQSSSDDDSDMPNFGSWVLTSADDAEAGGGDARGARLAARRATMRRQVAHAATALRLAPSHHKQARLAYTVKKHLNEQSGPGGLQPQIVHEMLASLNMPGVLSAKERRRLRCGGWSGGDGAARTVSMCVAEDCDGEAMPCASYCLAHVTLAPEQRLYASCAAVFAGGTRCRQPLLQLHDQTPLCLEHAWKRDNYDKISRECKPKKVAPRKRPVTGTSNRRAKRRRRPPPAAPRPIAAPSLVHTITTPDVNVCSNSSTYDSSEDTGIGGLSETEFMAGASDHTSLDVSVAEHVLATQQPPDDILDSSVLHQIPDEAFTEFFNQTEDGSVDGFAESEELARALEAVLDERVLDSLTDCVFTHSHSLHTTAAAAAPIHQHNKVAAPGVEMSSATS